MNNTKSPVTKDEKSSNGHHFSESNQSAFRRISSIKSDPTDKTTEKPSKNGTSLSTDDLLTNKASLSNPFLSPLISSSADFHSHLALLRPFLSQTLPFVPTLTSPSYWHTLPFLHPYLSSLRPPGLLPPPISPLPTSSSLSSSSSSSVQPKASTSTNNNNKKSSSSSSSSSSSATHYHQYTITNNNVLVPSPATLIDFIRRPTTSNGSSTNAHNTTSNVPKSKNLKKYKCDICSRAFSRSNTLVTHKRIHTGEKPFVCEICDRAFRQPGNLTRHKLTHTAAKPYSCPICSKAFNRASNLHAHQRTHSIIMPMITKSLTTSSNSNNNTTNGTESNKNNNGVAAYKCNECHEVFGHKFELNLHNAAIHHSQMGLFSKTNTEDEIDDGDDEEDIEDEQSYEKEEDASNESEPNIDLVDN